MQFDMLQSVKGTSDQNRPRLQAMGSGGNLGAFVGVLRSVSIATGGACEICCMCCIVVNTAMQLCTVVLERRERDLNPRSVG